MRPPVFIITGAMASGKSTVAAALAKRFEKSAYVEGDAFLRMIVSGGANLGPVLDAEAMKQLELRQSLGRSAARDFAAAGFAVVYEDILIGEHLVKAVEHLSLLKPHVIVLAPSAETLAERDMAREKTGYSKEFPPAILANALENETPRIGIWIDNSEMTVDEVVEAILREAKPL